MIWVDTTLGRVPVWGSFDGHRPLVLAIRGAFPEPDHLADLAPPGCDMALLHLPGFHSPRLSETSVWAFTAAFDQVIQQMFAGRDITALGVSTGALVALGLQSPEVRRVLVVEPFFSTAKLWPLIEFLRRELRASDQTALHQWVEAIFGVTLTRVVDRDYRSVLAQANRTTTLALVGDIPLSPRRPVMGFPSLTDDEDRAALPCRVVAGGHGIPTGAIRAALADLHEHYEDAAVSASAGIVAAAT